MNSQTARPPRRTESQRSARSAKNKRYVKQTAHVEARRDGQPLIFGWGGHLSRSEKTRIQQRAIWTTTVIIAVLIVAVVVGYWVNLNIIIPSLPITTVNGHPIPQSDYRKLLALKAQFEANTINGPHGLIAQRDSIKKQIDAQQKILSDTNKQIETLKKQLQSTPNGSTQHTNLAAQLANVQQQNKDAQAKSDSLTAQYQNLIQNTIPQEQQLFTQSQQGNDSATWLQDDELIREWLATQSNAIQAKIEPSQDAINHAISAFIADLPKGSSYSKFLSDNHVSDDDVHAMMALKLRRDNMQTYLSSLVTSPTYQVLVRAMTISTQGDAEKVLQQLKSGADFGKLAKDKSVDTNSNSKGGDLGWLARGQYIQNEASGLSGLIDNWIFDPARKVNELSPILTENGTYHIVQIMGIDPSRDVDAATLKSLKDNALTDWLLEQRAMPGVTITPVDQDKLLDPTNMPPALPTAAPGDQSGGQSGGLPGGSVPGQP
jgi:parvulin-like peptidyl-prolyl isomerase